VISQYPSHILQRLGTRKGKGFSQKKEKTAEKQRILSSVEFIFETKCCFNKIIQKMIVHLER
jgi:hypothetical protein